MSDDTKETFTRVVFADEARKELFKGIETTYNVVASTLGPRGHCVLIQTGDNKLPISTKDGITVSKSIHLRDPLQRMGSKLLTEASANTNDIAGDGTTTASVLSYAMIKQCLKLVSSGYDPIELSQGIDCAVKYVSKELLASAKKLTTPEEVAQIATISANGDKTLGTLVASAIEKVGIQGIVTVEDAKGTETSLCVVDGLSFERGFLSPYFVTNQEKMCASFDNAYVFITDKKLSSAQELIPLLETVVRSQKPLLVIADDIEGEALHLLVVNRLKSGLKVVGVKAPGYGQHKVDVLRDLCTLTSDLGTGTRVTVDAKSTTIVANNKEAVQQRVEELQSQLQDVTLSGEDQVKLRYRIARLSNGVAMIRCGGVTEVDMIERKYRLEDSLNATRAAVEMGIVPGGGIALWRASESVVLKSVSRDFDAGCDIVKHACKAPLRRIVENANKSPDVVELKVREGFDYDASCDEYCNLVERGVIDPIKVELTALKNAASVATTFLQLDACVVTDE
jgi:chaperonin GroEL